MAFQSAFLRLMPDTITISTSVQPSTSSPVAIPSWSTAGHSFPARYVERDEIYSPHDGETIRLRGHAWIGVAGSTQWSVPVGSRVTLPDGSYAPCRWVERYDDTGGMHHQKLMIGFENL